MQPSEFGLSTIADNPAHLQMWNNALKSASTSRRENGYIRYLNALESGSPIDKTMLDEAFSSVNSRFTKSLRESGQEVHSVHHWNFDRTEFSTQIVDPRHLVPAPTKQIHDDIHRATSSGTNIFVDRISPQHEILIPEWSTPLPPLAQ